MRYDARYESARATSQSERGWDFRPVETERGPVGAFAVVALIVAVAAGVVAVVV